MKPQLNGASGRRRPKRPGRDPGDRPRPGLVLGYGAARTERVAEGLRILAHHLGGLAGKGDVDR
ncbi:hypothetical protein [Streptosporangium sp. NPDC051022]|uniref:hypothetical protein n=1 Tax=Streptosporangium sp. NPDC051022 TaxID=3155752 RepID=UPI0034212A0F